MNNNKFIRLYQTRADAESNNPILINVQHIVKVTKIDDDRCLIWLSSNVDGYGYDVAEFYISFDSLSRLLCYMPPIA